MDNLCVYFILDPFLYIPINYYKCVYSYICMYVCMIKLLIILDHLDLYFSSTTAFPIPPQKNTANLHQSPRPLFPVPGHP